MLKVKDLIKGKYYCEPNGWRIIFIFPGNIDYRTKYITCGRYESDRSCCSDECTFREATTEEIRWLDACIRENRLVPEEEALRSDNYDIY